MTWLFIYVVNIILLLLSISYGDVIILYGLDYIFMLSEFTTVLYSVVIHFFWRCHHDPVCCSKNGSLVGAVYKDIKGPLFPTIAVHSQNEE